MHSARRPLRPRVAVAALALACAATLSSCSSDANGDDAAFPVRGDLTEASLEIAGGATEVNVVTGETDGALFVTKAAEGSVVEPVTTENGAGHYELDFTLGDNSTDTAVTVYLDPEVVWHLTFTGGAKTLSADLSGGKVASVDFATGAETFDLTLPAPTTAVAVNQSGGASMFSVTVPADVAATVSFEQGVGSATLDGTVLDAATSTATVGDDASENRYVITNSGGLAAFTLDRS